MSLCFVKLLLMLSVGDTPLAYAVRGRSIDGVKYLLDHGSNPDKPDNKGYTPLHVAAIKGPLICTLNTYLLSYACRTLL